MTEKKTIREVIVVEGKHDTENLRKYFNCDTIETSGTHLGKEILEQIRCARDTRGVIIFTDPDSPGNRIRFAVNEAVPGCKNAFVNKRDAHTTKKVGIEHAGYEALYEALSSLMTYDEHSPTLSMRQMVELGLSGGENSTQLREKVGDAFHIGQGTAKTMLRRLNCLQVTEQEIKKVLYGEDD